MTSDIERAWRPRFYRAWNFREGAFYWAVTTPITNSWTGPTLHSAKLLERRAHEFAMHLNAMARQQRAVNDLNHSSLEKS